MGANEEIRKKGLEEYQKRKKQKPEVKNLTEE